MSAFSNQGNQSNSNFRRSIDPSRYIDMLSNDEEGPYTSRYSKALEEMPTRETTKPSKWRRFGAIMSSLGSRDPYNTAKTITEEPYTRAMGDWSNKAGQLQELAKMEQEGKINRYKQLVSMLNNESDNAVGWANADSNRMRAENDTTKTGYLGNADRRAEALLPFQESNAQSLDQSRANTGLYQQGMLRQGQGNLGLRGKELGLRERELSDRNSPTNPGNVARMLSALGGMTNRNTPQNSYLTPQQQEQFEQAAASDVLSVHPEWADYFDEYGKIKPDTDPTAAAELTRWVRKYYQDRVSQTRR